MYNRFVYVAISLFVLICSSCSSIYMPNVPATPMFHGKGEVHVAAHSNVKGDLSGKVGVAVGNHIAVIASGSYIKQREDNNWSGLFRRVYVEGGPGCLW